MAFNMYNVPHSLIKRGVGPTPHVEDEGSPEPMVATSAAMSRTAPVVKARTIDENGSNVVKTPYGKSYDSNNFYHIKTKSITVNKGATSSSFTLVNSSGVLLCLKGQAKVIFDENPLRFTIQDGTEVSLTDTDSFKVVAEETTTFRVIMSLHGEILETATEEVKAEEPSTQLELDFEPEVAEAAESASLAAARQKAKDQLVAQAMEAARRQQTASVPRAGFMAGVNPMPGRFPVEDS
jgi:hypothetical protein